MPKYCLYSVISNDYDTPKRATLRGVDHILFTDDKHIHAPGWRIVEIDKTEDCRLQRKIKILGHPELDKYDVTIYVDGNVTLKSNFIQLLKSYNGGFWTGKHPNRNCIYAEGLAIKELGKAPENEVNEQIIRYYKENVPYSVGLYWNNVIIRDKSCEDINKLWWEELEKGCHRDQVSMAYAAWKLNYNIKTFVNLNYIIKDKHKQKEPIKVFYSTPFRSDKNIGKANNDFIELLPDDAWVCITDADAMFLNPDFGTRIEKAIERYGNEYSLIGCLTNRIGGLHQCYDGKFSEDMDVRNHFEIASGELEEKIVEGGVAGFCMIFSKETWKKVGGFKENTIKADTEFNKDIKKIGGKCGVYHGLYMFHGYRIWAKGHDNARFNVTHLQ